MTIDHQSTIDGLVERLGRYPADTHPVEHATLQFNLGLALAERPDHDRTAGLRASIAAYAAALDGFDALAFPEQRARVLTALGNAERELGLHAQARDRFAEALTLTEPQGSPAEYGAAANALGLAHSDAGEGQEAVAAFQRALSAFEDTSYPRQRATTLLNLGLALAGSGPEGAAAALERFDDALTLVDVADAPYVTASLHHARGTALLTQSEPAAAAEAFAATLEVFTRSTYPFQHAVAKANLAVALEEAHDEPALLRRALVHAEDAATVLDPRLHEPQWQEARRTVARLEQRLAEQGEPDGRAGHFAALLGEADEAECTALLRYRLSVMLTLPEPHRSTNLETLDRAITARSDDVAAITTSWMRVLMERPDDELQAALRVRHAVNESLPDGSAAFAAMERAMGDLEVLQRMRVRDLLSELGHERPDSS